MSDTTRQTDHRAADRGRPEPTPTTAIGFTADVRAKPLEELGVQLAQRGCRVEVCGGTLVVSLGVRGEWVIACDGQRFRWGGERGHVIGNVGAEAASAERAVLVLRQMRRRS